MLKALIKKELSELAAAYFISKKTGKKHSWEGCLGLMLLLACAAVSMGFAFFGMGMLFSFGFAEQGLNWLYYAMMGMIAVFFALIGEAFAVYSMLYKPKDNDLILSMPIPPRYILLARMSTLYLMSVLFTAVVFIPAMIAYRISVGSAALSVIFCFILIFVLALIALALACLLGWLVALVASKLKGNKAVISVLVSVALMTVYYVAYFRMNKLLNSAVENAEAISGFIKTRLIPLHHLGLAALGSPLYMLLFTLGGVALFVLVWLVLSKNFIGLVTNEKQRARAALRGGEIKAGSVMGSLLSREFRHFTSSAAYMLNCGFGAIMLLAAAVLVLVKSETILAAIEGITASVPMMGAALPCLAAAALMLTVATNCISAPSVSLEGANIWIVQSMPVEARSVLEAKILLHAIINGAAALIACVLFSAGLRLSALDAVLMTLCVLGFVLLTAVYGLMINIKKPRLDWTNETVPIKQGASVAISMFSGWGFVLLFGATGLAACVFAGVQVFLAVMLVVELGAALLIYRWITTRGAQIFATLQ